MSDNLNEEENGGFTVKAGDDWEETEFLIPAGTLAALMIQNLIENELLEKRMSVSNLGPEHFGRLIRYNENEEGVLEAIEHENKISHLTVNGKKLTTTSRYETVILLPREPYVERSLAASPF